jgi:hypothetical protein
MQICKLGFVLANPAGFAVLSSAEGDRLFVANNLF